MKSWNTLHKTHSKVGMFDVINEFFMLVIVISTLYPIWYIVVNSITGVDESIRQSVNLWPGSFSLMSYAAVFENRGIVNAFGISIARTVIATSAHVFFTAMVAFALSKKYLMGRKVYMTIGIITMLFNGGLIPNFLLIKNLGMYDKFIVYVIPAMFSFYNLIIFISFFNSLPVSLEESAKVDGANEFTIFLKIILPCSKAVVATLVLFAGVFNWNDFFMGVIYVGNEKLRPIQTLLYQIVAQSSATVFQQQAMSSLGAQISPEAIKFATMVIATLPIVVVYPLLQGYFVKGMMIGSIKG